MIRATVIQHSLPTANQREQFKQYASVPDNSRDALLDNCLTSAMLAVQAAADVALLDCTLRLSVDDVRVSDAFRLYQGGAQIVSVTDENGVYADFTFDGERLVCRKAVRRITVTYKNEVIPADAERLMQYVFQYATAMYDGEDPTTLDNILKQIYF